MTTHVDLPQGLPSTRSRPESVETRTASSWRTALLPAAGVLVAVTLWWLATDVLFSGRALLAEFSPRRTLTGLREIVGAGVLDHAASSVFRLLAGLAVATVVGVAVGALVGSHAALERAVRPALLFLRMVSPLSWAPVAVIALGIGDRPVIALVAATTVWPILASTAEGVASVDPGHALVARALGASRSERIRTVTVPAVRPRVLSGLRMAIGIGWVVLVPAEMLGVTSGLGYQILNAKDQLAYHQITALILVIGTIGYAVDLVARWALRTPRERLQDRRATRVDTR